MRYRTFTWALALAVAAASAPTLGADDAIAGAPLDPSISAMVAQISSKHIKATDLRLVAFGTRSLFSDRTSTATRGYFAARDWVKSQFDEIAKSSGGRMTVSFDTYTTPQLPGMARTALCSSVIAVLRGDEPGGRTYVLSSHLDSRNGDGNDGIADAPGADDNGSAASAVLEAARVMASHHFRATIVFAEFDGEEQGLLGSDHYAKLLKTQGVDVAGDINNDIIGSSHGHDGEYAPHDVRLFSEALPEGTQDRRVNLIGSENDSPSRELARFVKTTSEAYVSPMQADLVYRSDRFLRGGDQQSFTTAGFPAIRFVEAHENFDHQHQNVRVENGIVYGDLPQFVDFDYIARVTQMNVATVAALALGPAAPPNAQLVTRALGYDSTLKWSAVPGATSYEIVWRSTTADMWQFSRNVGNVTQATVPVSKDDDILGVRAVDAQGRRSVASYPVPVR